MCNTSIANNALDAEIIDFISSCKSKEHPESYLIAILHKVQDIYGYLSEENMDQVAHLLEVPAADVFGIATFYHYFRLKPKGRYTISVCLGTACFVKGANAVLDALKNELGIDLGETTNDCIFSLEGTRCLGVCALAPVVKINDKIISNVKPSQIPEIIKQLKSEVKQ